MTTDGLFGGTCRCQFCDHFRIPGSHTGEVHHFPQTDHTLPGKCFRHFLRTNDSTGGFKSWCRRYTEEPATQIEMAGGRLPSTLTAALHPKTFVISCGSMNIRSYRAGNGTHELVTSPCRLDVHVSSSRPEPDTSPGSTPPILPDGMAGILPNVGVMPIYEAISVPSTISPDEHKPIDPCESPGPHGSDPWQLPQGTVNFSAAGSFSKRSTD